MLIFKSLILVVASAHAGVANLGNQAGELKKAIPSRAFLNAINEYQCAEGAADQHASVDTEPEDSTEESDGGTEVPDDRDTGLEDEQADNGEFGMDRHDDSEGDQADEWEDE